MSLKKNKRKNSKFAHSDIDVLQMNVVLISSSIGGLIVRDAPGCCKEDADIFFGII